MTTITQAQLVATVQLAATDAAALYTAPTSTVAKIGRAVFTNTTASAYTITAGITSGGAIAAGLAMIYQRVIAPGESYVSPELAGQVLPPGYAIRAFCSNAASVNLTVSGALFQ